MRYFMSAALVIGLAMGGTALAGGRGHGGSHSGPSHSMSKPHNTQYHNYSSYKSSSYKSYQNYNKKFGYQFKYGWYYKGKNHQHWNYCYWSPSWGCYFYLDPCCNSYYYWCASQCCYYPVSYINVVEPDDDGEPAKDVPVVSPPDGAK
jgi:hypothetical protein